MARAFRRIQETIGARPSVGDRVLSKGAVRGCGVTDPADALQNVREPSPAPASERAARDATPFDPRSDRPHQGATTRSGRPEAKDHGVRRGHDRQFSQRLRLG